MSSKELTIKHTSSTIEEFRVLINENYENICREIFVEAIISHGDSGDIYVVLTFNYKEISVDIFYQTVQDFKKNSYKSASRVFSSIFLKAEFVYYLGCKATEKERRDWKKKALGQLTEEIEAKILKRESNVLVFRPMR